MNNINLCIMKDEKVIVTRQLIDSLIGYLKERPYKEVADLLHGLVNDVNANAQEYELIEKTSDKIQTESPVREDGPLKDKPKTRRTKKKEE